jgi:hypothetical protein
MEIKDVLERLTSKKASEEAIREIIEYHVTAALRAASEKVVMYDANDIDNPEEDESGMPYEYYTVDKDSIINAYPLTNIK